MRSILIIDDDEVDFMIYSRIIKNGKFPYYLSHADCGEAGIKFLEGVNNISERWPEYIFVDINMPGMDGFQFLERYSAEFSNHRDTKIYMVSSSDDTRDKYRANQLEVVTGFITKPLTLKAAAEVFNS